MEDTKSLQESLIGIQQELKAPKGQFNSFGKYKYRSAEDILEAVKPLLKKYGCVLTLSDKPLLIGGQLMIKRDYKDLTDRNGRIMMDSIGRSLEENGRLYIEATATLRKGEETISTTACARESFTKKGMDEPQVTGTASSYARKYALNGMFCIDDTKDPDTNEYHNQTNAQQGNHVQTAEPLSRKDNPKWQSFYNGVAQILSKAKTKEEVERLYNEKYIDNPDYQKYNLDQDDIFQEIFNKRLSQLKQ